MIGSKLQGSTNRNLSTGSLGGVIFGCNNGTMSECLNKQLFGLPGAHISYVKNIHPGLPLFLFNYSDRKLYGIFEAVSFGMMNIDPYAWTINGSEKTKFPAQVQVRVRQQCQPLKEDQFKPIIQDNYYTSIRFCFELDHRQTAMLMSNLSAMIITPGSSAPQGNARWIPVSHSLPSGHKKELVGASGPPTVRSLANSKECGNQQIQDPLLNHQEPNRGVQDIIYRQLKELAEMKLKDSETPKECVEQISTVSEDKSGKGSLLTDISGNSSKPGNSLCKHGAIIVEMVEKIRELCDFKGQQVQMFDHLQQKLLQAENKIKQLKSRVTVLESKSNGSMVDESLESSGSLILETGTLDSKLTKDETPESSALIENGIEPVGHSIHLDFKESIFIVGGYDGASWLSSLDLYSPSQDDLKSLKPMSCIRSHTAVVELMGELYVFGGGNGSIAYDTAESYNLAHNEWSPQPSLNEKKYHLAGAVLDNKIFAMGGSDGIESLSCVEVYDINFGRWIKARSMLHKRSALSAVELNGALYAVGGYHDYYLQSAERFDPREHSWCNIEGMSTPRGGHSLVVMNEKIYALGGYDGTEMTSSVEIYDPRLGIWLSGEPLNQFRGNAAAAVLNDSIYVIGGAPTATDLTTTVERYVEGQGWELVRNFEGPGRRCFSSAITLAGDFK